MISEATFIQRKESWISLLLFFVFFTSCRLTPEALEPLDVVILTGQSNMSGLADIAESQMYLSKDDFMKARTGIDGIYIFSCNDLSAINSGYDFVPFSEVTFGSGFKKHLFGPEIGFALECRKNKRSLVLINYSAGGEPINFFLEGNDISQKIKTFFSCCLLELKNKGYTPNVRAVCWMHGETDCNELDDAQNYYKREKLFIELLRKTYSENLLFIDSMVTDMELWSAIVGVKLYPDLVNEAKEKIAQEDNKCFLIDSSGLTKVDGLHYNTPSTIELGRRFAREFLAHSEAGK